MTKLWWSWEGVAAWVLELAWTVVREGPHIRHWSRVWNDKNGMWKRQNNESENEHSCNMGVLHFAKMIIVLFILDSFWSSFLRNGRKIINENEAKIAAKWLLGTTLMRHVTLCLLPQGSYLVSLYKCEGVCDNMHVMVLNWQAHLVVLVLSDNGHLLI
jgi:hypothetical protein